MGLDSPPPPFEKIWQCQGPTSEDWMTLSRFSICLLLFPGGCIPREIVSAIAFDQKLPRRLPSGAQFFGCHHVRSLKPLSCVSGRRDGRHLGAQGSSPGVSVPKSEHLFECYGSHILAHPQKHWGHQFKRKTPGHPPVLTQAWSES